MKIAVSPKYSPFQSTRPRGARRPSKAPFCSGIHFNPRAHEGRDLAAEIFAEIKEFQSTRPRGARRITAPSAVSWSRFQSTRPRGARLKMFSLDGGLGLFQSTRPRGARPSPDVQGRAVCDFNPRAHEGRDRITPRLTVDLDISIHAPTRGATANVQKNHTFAFVIISR